MILEAKEEANIEYYLDGTLLDTTAMHPLSPLLQIFGEVLKKHGIIYNHVSTSKTDKVTLVQKEDADKFRTLLEECILFRCNANVHENLEVTIWTQQLKLEEAIEISDCLVEQGIKHSIYHLPEGYYNIKYQR